MYIPLTFFSSQGSCITATTTTTSGTGSVSTGSFISGGFYWQYYQFNNNANTYETNPANYNVNFTIVSGSTSQAKLFLVGGGGAGGNGKQTICIYSGELTAGGGGGGGGIVYYDNFTLSPNTYQISVGVGGGSPGTPGRQGGNTTFNYTSPWTPFTSSLITAYGGGYGGWVEHLKCNQFDTTILYQGSSGGSAGGNVNSQGTGLAVQTSPCCNGLGGLYNANQGFAGGYGYGFGNTTNGSGGGGAGGEGQAVDQSTQQTPGYGGPGQAWGLTGTSLTYAAGGGAVRAQGFPTINQSSADGNGTAGIGNGGHGSSDYYDYATQGTSGTVIIAWPVCSSKFACKTFAITGSGGTINYAECQYGNIVTSSPSIGAGYGFTACLTTWSGSNVPILLTGGITTSSVIGNCDSVYTSSTSCSCTSYYYVPNGTQTVTWAYCDSNLLRSRSISTGTVFCTNPAVPGQGLTGAGSTITLLGVCSTGSCSGTTTTTTTTTSTTTTTTTTLPPTNISCSFQFVAMLSNGTWSYTDCNSNVTASAYTAGYTSSVSPTSLICVSSSAGLTGDSNQLFKSPYNCSYTSSQTTTQQITFAPNVTYNWTLASWIPSGSTSYSFRIIPYSQSFGPVCTLSGSAYRSSGAIVPLERLNMVTGSLNC